MSVSSSRAKFQLKLNLIVSHRLWLQYGPINVLIMTFWYLSWVRCGGLDRLSERSRRSNETRETNQEAILQRVNWYFLYCIIHTNVNQMSQRHSVYRKTKFWCPGFFQKLVLLAWKLQIYGIINIIRFTIIIIVQKRVL